MHIRVSLLVVLSFWWLAGAAEEPSLGPAIEGYGPTYPINDRDVALQDDFVYKAVFDAASYQGELTSLNSRLVSVARFLNMHARNGTPADKMDLAVVVHGASVKNMLSNEAYRTRYEVANPNLELVEKLQGAGVRFYICGQSMAFGGIKKSELADHVAVGLSAMTMLTVLQAEGYALLPGY